MSYIYFGNLQASVPPTLDTTPCMHQMLQYEDCVVDTNSKQYELLHPSWPSVWPRMLTDGKIIDTGKIPYKQETAHTYILFSLRPLTKKKKQYLWECEQERFVFKACLRTLIGLKRTPKHTSWDTAPISNITIT